MTASPEPQPKSDDLSASGRNPMDRSPNCVDVAHAMSTTLRYTQHDQLAELMAGSVGRFGREVRTIANPKPELARARAREVKRMRQRQKSGYEVDPRLVAIAILERLSAGGLKPPVRKATV
jgi:hypothetical protein